MFSARGMTRALLSQVWQLGRELTMVTLAGEVVVDCAIRLQRELKVQTLWPVGYASDLFAYLSSAPVGNDASLTSKVRLFRSTITNEPPILH
jgi:hypothetical protein